MSIEFTPGDDATKGQGSATSVTEVWPDKFELEVKSTGAAVPTTAVHTLEKLQLEALYEQIEEAIHDTE